MKIFRYPSFSTWDELLARPIAHLEDKFDTVRHVMSRIQQEGDSAVRQFTLQFDQVDIAELKVTVEELEAAAALLDADLKEAIQTAARHIDKFHMAQKGLHPVVETMLGVTCWQKSVAIERVGLYIPGGSAPLFSTVLMLAIPAQIAGCREVVLCTPPDKEGNIHPAILYAASVCRVSEIFKVGGMQAIGAMAYGTQTVPKVDKIFGPGNSWVMAAKQYVAMADCAIDMPAGPSEVAVMADDTAVPAFVAADLLSQAEHGPDSQVILVTTSEKLIKQVIEAMGEQLKELSRAAIATKALDNSRAILLREEEEMITLINYYAPEHLIIATHNPRQLADRIMNAGSVFIGNYTPESAGDYASGTNHTLPTSGWAKSHSGVGLDSFTKKITFQEITPKGIQQLGPIIEVMAEAEQLTAHQLAARLRRQH